MKASNIKQLFFQAMKLNIVFPNDVSIAPRVRELLAEAGVESSASQSHYPIHLAGWCCTCCRPLSFPDGTAYPIVSTCIKCWGSSNNRPEYISRILQSEFYYWKPQWQKELVAYLTNGEQER